MRLVTVAGPPSSGKTSVILKIIQSLSSLQQQVGVVKFDCVTTHDDELYRKKGIPVLVGLSGNLCPDHYFVTNVDACVQWGQSREFDILITESAGLCNRCSPYIGKVLSVCVIDNLSGINTPAKIGPLLKLADIVLITKGDIVSQAEREVFLYRVRQANPKAVVMHVNGLTGQGIDRVSQLFLQAGEVSELEGAKLRFSMPAAVCSYCLGETTIGQDAQMGNVRKITIPKDL